jgi:hypothetical protein
MNRRPSRDRILLKRVEEHEQRVGGAMFECAGNLAKLAIVRSKWNALRRRSISNTRLAQCRTLLRKEDFDAERYSLDAVD